MAEDATDSGRDEDGELIMKELRFMEEDEVEELIESKGWLHARFVYEVQQMDQDTIREALKKVIATLRAQDGVEVSDCKYTNVEKINENVYSMVGDVGVLVKKFDILLMLILNITPSNVLLLEPEKLSFSLGEMQNILSDVGHTIEHLTNENFQLGMKLEALASGKGLVKKE